MEEKETCATMQPCKGEIAELHNQRVKELDYIRKDLSCLNSSFVWRTIKEQMRKIRAEYKKATGQKLQPSAEPIQEIVVVTDVTTTSSHIETFCELVKGLGMTPLSYAIHRDEGHYDPLTGEWIPNYHAHIIVDTTCWEHKRVERTKKSQGRNIIDSVTRKPVKVGVDGYAKTIKFTRQDMSRLQDFAAEATGLKRGKSSDRKHLNSLKYKVQKYANEVKLLMGLNDELKAKIAAHEKEIRGHVQLLQNRAKEVLRTFDAQERRMTESNIAVGEIALNQRNELYSETEENVSEAHMQDLVKYVSLLSGAIVDVAMATTSIFMTEVDGLKKKIDARRSVLAELTARIKHISIWVAIKGALNTLLGRPVNRQVEKVMRENEEQGKTISIMTEKVEALESATAKSSKDLEARELTIVNKDVRMQELRQEKNDLLQTIHQKDVEIRRLESQRFGLMLQRNKQIAENLLDNATPEQIQQYERQGLPELIGDDIWTDAKVSSGYRKRVRDRQQRHESDVNPTRHPGRQDFTPGEGPSRHQ